MLILFPVTTASLSVPPTISARCFRPIKKFIDESVKYFKKLDGKAAAAFTSEGMIGGGGDIVVLDILKCFLIHGCVVQGLTGAGHFGPVAVGKPDERIAKEVDVLVEKFASLVNKV